MFCRFLSLFAIIAVSLAGPADSLTGEALQRAFVRARAVQVDIELVPSRHATLISLFLRGSNTHPNPYEGDALYDSAYDLVKDLTVEEAQKQYINKVAEHRHDFSL
jgi:hypothetical protein